MEIGKTIKLIRILRGYKQKELAELLAISHNYLSAVENNKREPSLSFIKNVSASLEIPISFLFLENLDDSLMTVEQKKIFQNIHNLLIKFQEIKKVI